MIDTVDPSLRSFIPVEPDSPFPIQNLPYGIFKYGNRTPRVGVALGEWIVDLAVLERHGLIGNPNSSLFNRGSLNAFMAAGRDLWWSVRGGLSLLLRHDSRLRDDVKLRDEAFVPAAEAQMLLPVEIGDYTDFYSSREHATTVGSMLRGPENALMPNWLHLPVAYHGRASSVVVSGTDLRRPYGQTKADTAAAPNFGPSNAVDYELELGAFIGTGNDLGSRIGVREAPEHVFGLVLVNDWSARDVQKWEYVPLGPFLAKNFGTSISPWVVPLDALAPFRVKGPKQDPEPLPYLRQAEPRSYDVQLEVTLEAGAVAIPICRTNARGLYWSFAQQIAHHTSNGCNLRPGDLLATGTISGPTSAERGCLLERTLGGNQPLTLPNGQQRTFLADGDRITITGWCEGDDYRVGFGEVTGKILPALPLESTEGGT